MDAFKKMMGYGGEGKAESGQDPGAPMNKSMTVPKERSPAAQLKPLSKEDPGPLQGKMVSYKRTMVKTVTDNKKHLDQKTRNMDPSQRKQLEEIMVRHESDTKESGLDLDVSYTQLTADLVKVEDDKELNVLKETIKHLHHTTSLIRKLEKHEQGLVFPISTTTKEESELVQHLRADLARQATDAGKLREQIDGLTKERNKALEDLARVRTELDTRSKKIAELNYTNRCASTKIQELQKHLAQASNVLEETKRMYSQEQYKAMKELGSLKTERAKLQSLLDEERTTRKTVEKEKEDLQREIAARAEELRLSKSINTKAPASKLNESTTQAQQSEAIFSFHAVMECSTVYFSHAMISHCRQQR